MNKALFFILSIFVAVLLPSFASDSCYSVQFASSYSPIDTYSFPEGSKAMKIGRVWTVRYGCYDDYKIAKNILYQFKNRYPNSIIVSTYKWRFKNQQREKYTINNYPQKISKSPSKEFISHIDKNRNYSVPRFYSTQPIQSKIEKCYTVQLDFSREKLSEDDFPIGTKIVKRGSFFSAFYGCFDNIGDAKRALYEMRKEIPKAVVISVPKHYVSEEENRFSKIEAEERPLISENNYINESVHTKEQKLNFYKANNEISSSKTENPKRCYSSVENKLIPCEAKSIASNRNFPWENIDMNAVEGYVDSKLDHAKNIETLPKDNYNFLEYNELNETNSSNNLFPFSGKLNYYITATLDWKDGQNYKEKHIVQENNITKQYTTTKMLKTRSLTISPGLTYLYYFNPFWYFFTNDRLILRINESSAKLDFDVKELYVRSQNLFDNYANFLIGRKYLKDKRGWYYKTSLDTIGVSNKNDLLLYELYLGERLTKNTSSYDPNEVSTNLKNAKFLFAHLSYEYYKDNTIEGFFIHEDNKNAAKKLNWTGLRMLGKIPQRNFDEFSYWADIAHVSGDYKQNIADANKSSNIKGLGLDIGAKYYFANYYSAIAGSIAYGSGGGNLFVQPSFTNDRSNFLSKDLSFRYYGEFLQPELSNMIISSLYLLHYFNPIKDKTLILALHNYTQDNSSSTQFSATSKVVNPNGKSKDIGNEIDLILHYDLLTGTYWRFTLGYFLGGDAFKGKTNKKDGFNAQIYFKYLW